MTKKKEYTYRCWRCNKANDFGFCLDCMEKCHHCNYQKEEHIRIFEKYLCPSSFFLPRNDGSLV